MKLSAPVFQLKRQAKKLSREKNIPLHAALNDVARQEGYPSWSLLAAHLNALPTTEPAKELFAKLEPADLVLLGARPGHGKTMVGLELLAEAAKEQRHGIFFTMEFNEHDAIDRFRSIGDDSGRKSGKIQIDASDTINADHVVQQLATASPGTIAVIDYLQIMDQKRVDPELSEQVSALKKFAKKTGVIIVFISQIDRAYELSKRPVPDTTDVRLPNPLDLGLFDKACFLNRGEARIDQLGT